MRELSIRMMIMFYILIMFGLYRCIHLSKLNKCRVAHLIYLKFTSKEKNINYRTNAEAFKGKCTNDCNLLLSVNTSKIKMH